MLIDLILLLHIFLVIDVIHACLMFILSISAGFFTRIMENSMLLRQGFRPLTRGHMTELYDIDIFCYYK